MANGGSDFGERDEDEAALGKTGMRDFETGGTNDGGGVKEDVDVNGAGAERDEASPTELVFDAADGMKELERKERSFGGDTAVEKPGLMGEADRFGGVERGATRDADAGSFKKLESAGDVGGAVAKVGAEREIDLLGLNHWVIWS